MASVMDAYLCPLHIQKHIFVIVGKPILCSELLSILLFLYLFCALPGIVVGLFTLQGIWDVEQDSVDENSCHLRVYTNVAFSKRTIFRGKMYPLYPEWCSSAFKI